MPLEENRGWVVTEAEEGSTFIPCLPSGTHKLGELVKDTLYLRSCQAHNVVPASCFLRQGSAPELNLRHRGLGPQVPLEGPQGPGLEGEDLGGSSHVSGPFLSPTRTLCGRALCQAHPIPHSG